MDEKYLAAIDAAYFSLEEKKAELLSALSAARLRTKDGWHNGHYHKNELGEWERESYPIPVLELAGLCDVEIGFNRIGVSTKLSTDRIDSIYPEDFTPLDFEVYDTESFLEDIYTSRQPFAQLKTSVKRHPASEVGFTFYFPPNVTAKPILELILLLDKAGFYM